MVVKKRRAPTCMPADRLYTAHRRFGLSNKSSTSLANVTSRLAQVSVGSSAPERRVTRRSARLLRENQPFRLLELPPEMRVRIYREIEVEDLRISARRRGTLTSTSKMIYVSQQVGEEFITELHRTAPISAIVVAFDFRHIVTALNRLMPADVKSSKKVTQPLAQQQTDSTDHEGKKGETETSNSALEGKEARSHQNDIERSGWRAFTIELQITQINNRDPTACLTRWLNRFDSREEKAGTDIDFQYTIIDSAQQELGRERVTLLLEVWEEWLEEQEKKSHWVERGGCGLQELKKISLAITQYCNDWHDELS